MRSIPLALLAALVVLLPGAGAAQPVSDEADRLLWCASAFRLMGAVAETPSESDRAVAASEMLTLKAAEHLHTEGVSQAQAAHLPAQYDERVVAELETGALSYAGEDCSAALDP
ncbi:hypothetical protein [Pelagibacterium lacus]|uniref:Uncharacterized protein n=1 Tax=Pelagibacterium lacus TaxID=2282655 RepID=A0A369W3I5_9HYPH|nr:hypothetical protein [Pelagibacterium lacus]RDE08557.1 hypothetical protein DVH29_11125 [Pelagibacterium lacus]